MKYTVVPALNDEEFGQKAADVFIKAIEGFQSPPSVILPTGDTPLPFYDSLVDRAKASGLSEFYYCQLDEYLGLHAGHEKLFINQMKKNLLDPLNIRVRLAFESAANPGHMIDNVISRFSYAGHPDLAVIGIGGNGHVGFNEPGSAFEDGVRVVTLSEQTIYDNSQNWDLAQHGEFPTRAITLGISDLKKARQTILLVRGEKKANILARALTGPIGPSVPASYLQEQQNVTVVADMGALSQMSPDIVFK